MALTEISAEISAETDFGRSLLTKDTRKPAWGALGYNQKCSCTLMNKGVQLALVKYPERAYLMGYK